MTSEHSLDLVGLDRWITTTDAAALAGVEPDTLRHYARSGHAPAPRRFGRTLVWDRAEVVAWLAARPGRGTRTDRATDAKARP